MKSEKVTLPCENCICLPICRDIYNDFLLTYIEELSRKQLSSFKVAAKAKARIKLANRCSIFDNYLYDPKIDGIENLNREMIHHLYFIKDHEILWRHYPCQRKITKIDSHVEDV